MDDEAPVLTRLLHAWSGGDAEAASQIVPVVYGHLRRIAGSFMRDERPGHTLAPTALVHEAWMRLESAGATYNDRTHFFSVAASAMRRILVDHARERGRKKRGGNAVKLSLEDAPAIAAEPDPRVLGLDEALRKLESLDPRKAQIVELVFFGGLTWEEAATVLQVSPATIQREMKMARAWLLREMSSDSD